MSALLLADLLAHVLMAPVAGALVDRRETVRVLVVASLAQTAVAAILAFTSSVPLIVLLLFLLGAGASVVTPAVLALVPRVVGQDRITQANAHLEVARYAGGAAGPALAGILSGFLGTGSALLADAATFAVLAAAGAALSVRRLPAEAQVASEERGRSLRMHEAKQGFLFLLREPVLRLTAVVLTITVVFAVMDNVALVFFAKDTMHVGDSGYGAMITAWTAGMVVGIVLVARRLPVKALAISLLVADAITGAAVLAAAIWALYAAALGLFILAGAGKGICNV